MFKNGYIKIKTFCILQGTFPSYILSVFWIPLLSRCPRIRSTPHGAPRLSHPVTDPRNAPLSKMTWSTNFWTPNPSRRSGSVAALWPLDPPASEGCGFGTTAKPNQKNKAKKKTLLCFTSRSCSDVLWVLGVLLRGPMFGSYIVLGFANWIGLNPRVKPLDFVY